MLIFNHILSTSEPPGIGAFSYVLLKKHIMELNFIWLVRIHTYCSFETH